MGESTKKDRSQRNLPNRLLVASVTLAVIATVISLRGTWELPIERYVIIHADDAGMCRSVNQATIDAMEKGLVSSASIMVPCPGFDEFAEYAQSRPTKDFGVHLTLTSDWDDVRWGPVSDPATVPSLVDSNGHFWKTSAEVAEHADIREAESELRAQINKALTQGIRVSHLDNHMNSLFRRPDLLSLYVRLGKEFRVPVRFSKTLPDGWSTVLPQNAIDAYYAQLKVLYTHQNPLADYIDSDNYDVPANEKRNYFFKLLRDLEPGVTEIVIHCGYADSDAWSPPDAAGREGDTRVFLALETADEIKALGIPVIDWKQFQQLKRETFTSSP